MTKWELLVKCCSNLRLRGLTVVVLVCDPTAIHLLVLSLPLTFTSCVSENKSLENVSKASIEDSTKLPPILHRKEKRKAVQISECNLLASMLKSGPPFSGKKKLSRRQHIVVTLFMSTWKKRGFQGYSWDTPISSRRLLQTFHKCMKGHESPYKTLNVFPGNYRAMGTFQISSWNL